ncbi:MAG: histidine phosphatase family protein [Clostridia bacterium]|nr:histidine phosphatase family protein [Clostridia bacterium]
MKLTLIRHGITRGNLERLYYGSTDLPLLPESAERLKKRAALGAYPAAERYYTSGMLRTEQTFEAIYGDIPHGILPGMREIDFGDFEMRSYEELKDDPAYIEWISGDNEKNVCPGGESGVIVTERALKALAPVISEGRDAVVVTHGGVIGGVLAAYFPVSNGRYGFTPEPERGFTVEFSDGKPILVKPI